MMLSICEVFLKWPGPSMLMYLLKSLHTKLKVICKCTPYYWCNARKLVNSHELSIELTDTQKDTQMTANRNIYVTSLFNTQEQHIKPARLILSYFAISNKVFFHCKIPAIRVFSELQNKQFCDLPDLPHTRFNQSKCNSKETKPKPQQLQQSNHKVTETRLQRHDSKQKHWYHMTLQCSRTAC